MNRPRFLHLLARSQTPPTTHRLALRLTLRRALALGLTLTLTLPLVLTLSLIFTIALVFSSSVFGPASSRLFAQQAPPQQPPQAPQRQPSRAWPPAVRRVSGEAPALAPDAAMKTFVLPPGYRVELVASEPMIQDPIWIDIDPDGRLWVVEMRGFMPNAAGENERAPVGRISVLEDLDDDGRMDKSTVFLDGLVLPRSVKVLDRGVLVAEPPHLWLARDTDGDLRADTKEAVREDFGRAQGNPEHNANGLLWGLDNWIYTSEHDGHLRLKRAAGSVPGSGIGSGSGNGAAAGTGIAAAAGAGAAAFEHQKTLLRGQWGLSMDDVGRVYRNWNESPLFVDLFPARYLLRNPHLARTRGSFEVLMEQKDMIVWPIRPTRGVNRGYREGTLRPDGTLTTYVAAGTPVVYRGDRLPEELRGNVFVTEPAGNLVHRLILSEEPASGRLRARNAYARGEFLASTDERFRPVNLMSAPDGTLLVVDMYRGIIQHGTYQSEYLKSHIREHRLDQPIGYGRIYRIVHESTRRGPKPALSAAPGAALVAQLAHPNGWWRDTAQRLLVERGDRAVAPALRTLVAEAPDERTRLHALWTLDGLEALDVEIVQRALSDRSAQVRAAAVRVAEPWLRDASHAIREPVGRLSSDPSPVVLRQLALSLGELPADARDAPLADLLVRHGDDPVLVDAAISSLRGHESAVLERLLAATTANAATRAPAPAAGTAPAASGEGARAPASAGQPASATGSVAAAPAGGASGASTTTPVAPTAAASGARAPRAATRDDAVAMLAGAIMNSGDAEAIERLFGAAAREDRPAWQRLALLRGADAAVVGRGLGLGPGGVNFAGVAVASSAGAAGAAGAAGVAGAAGAAGADAGGLTPRVTLARRPEALFALVASKGRDVAALATRIAAAMDWPGKPKPAGRVVAPLTPDEQRRFTAGQVVYQNLCAACHQADGRGQDALGPPLVGSKWVLGRAGLAARIVLNGKEGAKMMPPLQMLSNDQVAAALTYVRRSWGHGASAVDPNLVREVRGASTGRTRPWTEAELMKVTQPDGPPRAAR